MTDSPKAAIKAALDRILVEPTPADLWALQKDLLAMGGEPAQRAREVARAFHDCLRNLDSKTASRSASRWGAVLGTAAVSSVGIEEMLAAKDNPLQRLLASGVSAGLEVGASLKTAQAWELEARLMYDEMAWFLYGELWEISRASKPRLAPAERKAQIDLLLDPVLDPRVADGDKAALLVWLFQAALAVRLRPIVRGGARRQAAEG